MSPARPGPSAPDPAAGIRDLERFLAAEAQRARARHAAETFADRMPHLAPAEHRQLVHLYTREHLAWAHRLQSTLARRRAAQEAREALGRRCATVALLIGTASACFAVFVFQALVPG